MKYSNEQLVQIRNNLASLINQKINFIDDCLTVKDIEVDFRENDIKFIAKEGFAYSVKLFMRLDDFEKYNPEHSHLLEV